ncbi:MAG: hypothetical protein ACI4P7_07030 [Bacilli bacterium]
MGEISVSKILDSLANISTQIVTSQESIAKIKNGLSGVSNNAEQLAKYDGEIKYINHITVDNNKLLSTVIWLISVPNNLQNASKNINARIKDSVEWLERLNTEINNSEEIALYIESQVNDLSKNLSTTDLATTFSALSANIAMDEYSVARKKFVNISDKNMKYWTDKPLQFQWDSKTGSYLILQEDSNGKLVGMGWTDKEGISNYVKEIEKCTISTTEFEDSKTDSVNDSTDDKEDDANNSKNQVTNSQLSGAWLSDDGKKSYYYDAEIGITQIQYNDTNIITETDINNNTKVVDIGDYKFNGYLTNFEMSNKLTDGSLIIENKQNKQIRIYPDGHIEEL